MIEWKQDEYSELKIRARFFELSRSLYLKGFVFALVIGALGLIGYLIDGQMRNFIVPAVIFFGMSLFYAVLMAVGFKEEIDKTFFFDDEHLGYKNRYRRYQLKWEQVLGVETKASEVPNIEMVTFQAQNSQLVQRPNLTMTVEKESAAYGQLMAKIAGRKLPVNLKPLAD